MAFPTQNPDELPRKIGDYELLEKIGDGTLGSVHRAKQISENRIVAVKILSPSLASDAAYMERFARDATAAATLQHPNLAAMYEVGESNGIYFCAMEYMPGDSLYRLVRAEGHLAQQTALGVCECIGGVLKLAWDNAQLTHGSLRPENIMLDAEGNAKLCDLGLAKDWSAESAEGAPPEVFSALNYRAPELTRPDAPPDPRADIYSMGMTLYFLLTGQVPFEAASWADVMARRLSETLPDPRDHAPETSAFACLLLERMLAKNPDDRYQSWDEVLRDLHLVYERKQPQAPQLPAGASVMRRSGAKIKIGGSLESATTASAAPPATTAAPKLSIKPSGSSPALPASKLKLKLPSQPAEPPPPPAAPALKLKLPSTPAGETQSPAAPSLKLPSKLSPLPKLKLPAQPVEPPPAQQSFGEETAPAAHQQEAAAPSFDETQPPLQQWSEPTASAESEQFQPTAAVEEVAAEPPKKKSWLFPILGLLLMLAVIGGGPWLLITLLRKAPPEHIDSGDTKNGAAQNGTEPNKQPKTPQQALALWSEIENHERNLPMGFEDRAELLRHYIAQYPDTPEAKIAQQKLDAIEPKLKSKAERLFEKTMAEIGAAMQKKDFDAARKLAADAAANAELKDYKPWFDTAANGAARQIGFWDSLTNNINALKGRNFTLQGVSGVIAGVVGDKVQLEQRLALSSSLIDIPLKKLSVAEAVALTRANNPTYNAETCLNFAWVYFAGGFARESSIMLDLAEKNGADVAPVRAVTAMLASGVDEYAAERELVQLRAALENRQWKRAHDLLEQLRERRAGTKIVQAAINELLSIETRLDLEMEIANAPIGGVLRAYTGHTAAIFSVACSYVGKTVVSASADGTARVWDVASAQQLHTLKGHSGEIHSVAVSPDAKFIVTGGADRTVRFWDVTTGEMLTVYAEHTAEVNAVAISLDGQRVATTGNDRIIKVLRAPLGAEIRGVKMSGETPMRCLALSRDGRFAAAGGNDRTVRQWDLTTGRERRKLEGHSAPVLCVALAPDGNTAFTGAEDGEVRQWDFSTSSAIRAWRAHDGKTAGISLSADGRFVATAGSDGAAKVWEVATGRELRVLRGHKGALRAVAFAADNRFLVTGGDDSVVKVWKLWDTDQFGTPILP